MGSNKFELQSTSSNFSRGKMQTTVSSNARYQDSDKRLHKNLHDLSDGIVGIRNISYYCYLNAFVQCLIPIEEMRDHYLSQEYAKYKSVTTKRDDFSYSNGLYLFYKNVFR